VLLLSLFVQILVWVVHTIQEHYNAKLYNEVRLYTGTQTNTDNSKKYTEA